MLDEHNAILSAAAYAIKHTEWCERQAQRVDRASQAVRRGQVLVPAQQIELLDIEAEGLRRSGQLGVHITTMLAALHAPWWLRCWAWLTRRPVPRGYGGS